METNGGVRTRQASMTSRKRPVPPPEGGDDGDGARQVKRWRPLVLEVLSEQYMRRLMVQLEFVVRRVVREEIRISLANRVDGAPRRLINRDEETRYRLQFLNGPAPELYTSSKVKAENGMPIQIGIIDTNLGKVVTCDPFSSVEVEIVVLPGDFGGDGQQSWNETKLNDHVVLAREGKAPLLTGKLVIKLSEGVGQIDDATFTDNSSTTRTKKFRLGVRIYKRKQIKERVREGLSEPFRVKERRVELNKKNHPPLLHDEVWRLEKIGKDGAFRKRLQIGNINTVQQFLQAFEMDQEKLRRLLSDGTSHKGRIPDNTWNAILKHAMERVVDDKLYSYSVAENNAVLIFNSVYQLVGAKFDGFFCSTADLFPFQKALVQKWKRLAFENSKDIKFDHIMVDNIPRPVTPTDITSVPGPSPSHEQNLYLPAKQNGDMSIQAGPLHEVYARQNELSSDHTHGEGTSSECCANLLHQNSPLQENNTSCFSNQNGKLLVESSTMPVPTVSAPCSIDLTPADQQIPENPMIHTCSEQASNTGFHHPFEDSSTNLGCHHVQRDVFQENELDPSMFLNTHIFETDPCSEWHPHHMSDQEAEAMFREYFQAYLLGKWVKLIGVFKCVISICKSLAAKRTGFLLHSKHLKISAKQLPSTHMDQSDET